jgi:ribosomal protein L37AE/L43A
MLMRRRTPYDRYNAGRYGVMYGPSKRLERASEEAEIMREWKAYEEWAKERDKEAKQCQS